MDEKKKEFFEKTESGGEFVGGCYECGQNILQEELWSWFEQELTSQHEEFVKDLERAYVLGYYNGSDGYHDEDALAEMAMDLKELISKYKKNEE